MALIRASGKPNIEFFPKTASTAWKNGSVVALTSGQLTAATSSSTSHVGVVLRDSLSTDADYTSTTSLPVDVPFSNDIFLADVKSGVTATVTQVGSQCDFSITSNETFVDTGTNSHHQCLIVGFVSASQVLVKISSLNTYNNAAAA